MAETTPVAGIEPQPDLHAHGKAILFGEHAVVYNRPALAVALPHAITLQSLRATETGITLRSHTENLQGDDRSDDWLGQALRRLSDLVPGKTGMTLSVAVHLPISAGLGGSAALAVLLTRALAHVRNVPLVESEVRRIAHELERLFHGTPSGIDDALAVYGGVCWFCRNGTSQTDLPVNVNAKQLDTNTLQLDLVPPAIVIAYSGQPKSTYDKVAGVRARWEANTPHMENLFDAIADCVENGLAAWTTHDMTRLGQTLTDNHHLLQQIGVSTPTLDHMVELALSHGAYGAKLTGGGGGGCILALTPEQPEALREAFSRSGFPAWVIEHSTGDRKQCMP